MAAEPTKTSGTTLVLVAFGMAILAMLVTFFWIEQIKGQVKKESVPVLVLTRDVKASQTMVAGDVTARRVPMDFDAAFHDTMGVIREAELVNMLQSGQRYTQDAAQGTPLFGHLFKGAGRTGRAPPPPPGHIHFPLMVKGDDAVKTLSPGEFVRIRAPFKVTYEADRRTDIEYLAIMEKVPVVGLGEAILTPQEGGGMSSVAVRAGNYRVVTLEIRASDEENMFEALKRKVGEVVLIRINPQDKAAVGISDGVLQLLKTRPK